MIRCECGQPLLYREGWVHLRAADHEGTPDFPEDPAIANHPVQWKLREDGVLVRVDNY